MGGSGDVDARAAGQVACETATKTNMVMIFGEITTSAKVDYEKVVRDTCRGVGFTSDDVGLDCDKCKVLAPCLPAGGNRVCLSGLAGIASSAADCAAGHGRRGAAAGTTASLRLHSLRALFFLMDWYMPACVVCAIVVREARAWRAAAALR